MSTHVQTTGNQSLRTLLLFLGMALLLVWTGWAYNANLALIILNMGLISAVMALGVNLQWGYAGLFNIGVMGFVALGGLGAVLTAMPPTIDAWQAGGLRIVIGLFIGGATIVIAVMTYQRLPTGPRRGLITTAIVLVGYALFRFVYVPGTQAVEAVNPSSTGYLGGLGLPVVLSWPVGALMAAAVAWVIGKITLGLRSDYLAIATLGIAEIILAVMKNEDWLSRGVKNVNGIPRPVPYELDLQNSPEFVAAAANLGMNAVTASTVFVRLNYSLMFAAVVIVLLVLAQLALNSPWGRMMRAIRDNENAAGAMGKDVKKRHLQIFVIGSGLCGLAGAMMATMDGQLVMSSYQPLRFTFLIWVMVIVGGSGNNFGAVLGGMLVWWLWVMVEPISQQLVGYITAAMPEGWLRGRLTDVAPHTRLFLMGLLLLLVLRFSPRGLLPEK
ncbi:branched-chain amino acid ABC transporter permease [Ketogulonicigenium vulgare]|uniref:Branched-chain amino acid ABC transporter, permease protein n=1 Tax=Ketogulonicigenium vulgare (strain WSH-001) TaxID=759362 RepID=F9Y551_KETVW|nr:branched-chain amino acid ABC transporter permease [Ketogulonicigenium vulgare]AEM40683.1 Branched-chain amino acid ABC transporter, permease protein [Ketogulonicigenium vulgare WSH-001]ALJ80854.1 branched-chain amino acid ABC transporter permease [Ketogulonicigenium vulgare]ANW33631.1 branched-chain amino acid ABC transporter permease [Ketogulonicigenium vulgare]AOZ54397.1 Branched-chain amino acid ABC transporter, permease protein [Ketogulonicigenium vulgare]